MKLWGGRFRKEENKLMEEFNKSFEFDKVLYKQDIEEVSLMFICKEYVVY